jgi:hypothetical protein
MSGFKDHPYFQPRGNPTTLRQWERDNCKLKLGAVLAYGGFFLARGASVWLGLPMLLIGIWRLQGWLRRGLGIALLVLLAGGESDEMNVIRSIVFFGGFYLTWYMDGQDHNRKKELRDWERE